MSLETWKEEFYFVGARVVPVEHSLRKWIGLRRENLDKHGVIIDENRRVTDGDRKLLITADSCALCWHYYDRPDDDVFCQTCPLFIHLGCAGDSHNSAPYGRFIFGHDPEPMIKALDKCNETPLWRT